MDFLRWQNHDTRGVRIDANTRQKKISGPEILGNFQKENLITGQPKSGEMVFPLDHRRERRVNKRVRSSANTNQKGIQQL